MADRYILFVDDDTAQQDLFETAVQDWNGKNAETGRCFHHETAETVEQAEELLKRKRFDAALFDLRVRSEGQVAQSANPTGNRLALSAMRERGVPVGIMTADDSVLDEEVRTSGQVRVFDKNAPDNDIGNAYDQAIAWFAELWGMLDVLDAARSRIDGSAADVFLRRIWPMWSNFAALEDGRDADLVDIVTRQYVSHIAELLGLDGPDAVTWHPFEVYVNPSLLEDRSHTGDIFKFDEDLWVVLTPQCDMATQKVPNAILAKCVRGIKDWKENVEALKAATSKTKKKEPTEFLRVFVNQNLGPAKHFLPPLPGEVEPLLVHFGDLRSMSMEELNQRLVARQASIAAPFLSNIVQRFGSYISRMGQPDIDVERFDQLAGPQERRRG